MSVFPESADPGPYYAFTALVNATHSLGFSQDYEESIAKVRLREALAQRLLRLAELDAQEQLAVV